MQFVMGDFWTGNLAVALDKDGKLKQIFVVDWEVSKLGLAGIDVGQFSAELYLLKRCHGAVCGEAASAMLEHFLEAYEPTDEELRRAVVHLGCHLVVIPSFTTKGDSEITRAVAAEGVEVMVDPEKAAVYQLRRGGGSAGVRWP
jgi:5-methylthioribose kinase